MTQAPRDIQTQLRSLTIATEQRPASTANRRGGRGRWVLVIVLMSAAVVGVGGYVNRQRVLPTVGTLALSATADQPVRMLTVALAPDPGPTPVLTATGKIVSDHTVSVVTKVSGQIVALRFEQGDHVEQGSGWRRWRTSSIAPGATRRLPGSNGRRLSLSSSRSTSPG